MSALRRRNADETERGPDPDSGQSAADEAAVARVGLSRLRLLRRSRGRESVARAWLVVGAGRKRMAGQRAPIVRRTSLRRVSSNSSNFSADSHSSQSTSSTAGRLSSDTSTRPSSRWTTCICSVLTWKFRSLPQFGQVNVTNGSPFDDFPCHPPHLKRCQTPETPVVAASCKLVAWSDVPGGRQNPILCNGHGARNEKRPQNAGLSRKCREIC